jgi:hypothetical protein
MTDKASPEPPKEEPDLARFLQDWMALWREELRAQSDDPEGMAATMELWRAAMATWMGASTMGMPPVASRDPFGGTSRAQAAATASDAGDAAVERDARGGIDGDRGIVERLTRRVDELEARLAKLETPRRRTRRDPG